MTKDVATDPDGGERKMSVPVICHEFEGEIINIPENKLLQRRRLLHAEGQTNTSSHMRSCSFRDRPRPKLLNVDIDRPRRSSLPSPSANFLSVSFEDINGRRSPEPLQRVRSFKTHKGGIVNRGDSFKRSSNSINSTGSAVHSDTGATKTSPSRQRVNSTHSKTSNATESTSSSSSSPAVYRVGMLGDKGVGKTSLTSQFMTSEFVAFDNDNEDDEEETIRHVPVLLNAEESILEFTDKDMHNKELRDKNFDAFVVVFSITDRQSYQTAVDQLYLIRHQFSYDDKPVLLLANKIDLVRKRKVSKEEGISIAKQYNSKYAETSAALNHHVDEVLVGILTQIRLKLTPGVHMEPPKFDTTRRLSLTGRQALSGPKKFLQKIFKKNNYKAATQCECENLFI